MRGGNSSSRRVGMLSSLLRAFSRAVVASFRRSPWMSRPLDADLSNGEMSLGRGVRNSLVASHSEAIDLPPIVGRVDGGTNDEAGASSKKSAENCGRCILISTGSCAEYCSVGSIHLEVKLQTTSQCKKIHNPIDQLQIHIRLTGHVHYFQE